MKPRIELQIERHQKEILKYSSFIALGFGAAVSIINKEMAILAPILAMPFAVDAIATKKFLNERKKNKTQLFAYKPFFKKSLSKWMKEYLNDSENLTEKKYKLIFLNLWAKHKQIPIDMIFNKDVISELSDELIKKGETSYSLKDMFYGSSVIPLLIKLQKLEIVPNKFWEEDKNNAKKITIAKKIYEEFAEIGMAGKMLIAGQDFNVLLQLQDYKFSELDFNFIKQYLEDSKEIKKEIYSINYITPYIDDTIETINKIISYEDNITNLNILSNYCENMKNKGYAPMMEQVKELQKAINVKFEYLNMSQELNIEKVPIHKKTNKI